MTDKIVLDENMVMGYIESKDRYPVDFDQAWLWAGYSSKSVAMRKLKGYFDEGVDFVYAERHKASAEGFTANVVKLTTRCFKEFCMVAKTKEGKQVRQYFIDCEERLQKVTQQKGATLAIAPSSKPVEERIQILAQGFSAFGLLDDPRCQGMAKDLVMQWVGAESGQALVGNDEPKWESATEIAEALGYNATAVQKVRSPLGKACARWYRDGNGGSNPPKEKRPCAGTMRPCNVYQRSTELDGVIITWLDGKGVSKAVLAIAEGA